MKPTHILCLVMLCLSGLAAPAFAASAEDDAIVAVLAADQARAAALVAADTNALNRLLADDLRYIHANGTVETKAIHVGGFAKGLRYESFKTSNLVGHVITADVVVVTGTIDQRKGAAGKMTDYHLLFQAVWRKKAGAWQLVSLETAIPSAS